MIFMLQILHRVMMGLRSCISENHCSCESVVRYTLSHFNIFCQHLFHPSRSAQTAWAVAFVFGECAVK